MESVRSREQHLPVYQVHLAAALVKVSPEQLASSFPAVKSLVWLASEVSVTYEL